MKVKMLLFLSLFSIICNGQSFDYRKDSLIESFDVKKFKKYNKDGRYNFYRKDSVSVHQLTKQKEFIEWTRHKKSNIKNVLFFKKKVLSRRKCIIFKIFQ